MATVYVLLLVCTHVLKLRTLTAFLNLYVSVKGKSRTRSICNLDHFGPGPDEKLVKYGLDYSTDSMDSLKCSLWFAKSSFKVQHLDLAFNLAKVWDLDEAGIENGSMNVHSEKKAMKNCFFAIYSCPWGNTYKNLCFFKQMVKISLCDNGLDCESIPIWKSTGMT